MYVGSSMRLEKRWSQHREELSLGEHHSPRLQHAWNKYGAGQFTFSVLEEVKRDRDALIEAEQRHMDEKNAYDHGHGFNILRKAYSVAGRTYTEQAIANISAGCKGRVFSAETRKKISATLIGNKRALGLKHSPETLLKISNASKQAHAAGKFINKPPHTIEARAAMSRAHKNRVFSDEHRRNISAACKAKPPRSKEWCRAFGIRQRKLDAASVDQIRVDVANGKTRSFVARAYGVCPQTVCNIVNGAGGYGYS